MHELIEAIEVPASPLKRARARLARAPSMPPARDAANDDSPQRTRADGPGPHGVAMLDEVIRALIRHEVRAEVARVVAIAPASPKYISVAEYAVARSISASTVRNAIRSGRLPAIRIGSAVRVPANAELGRPVAANANDPGLSPVMCAERILSGTRARSPRSKIQSVAA